MKFNNKEEIKNILKMNVSDEEKKNLIANIKNTKADLGRVIKVDYELDIQEGQEWDNEGVATSWTDRDRTNSGFMVENDREIEYVLQFENGAVEGYEVQYFDIETLIDNGMDEEEAERLAEDETYLDLMFLLGSDADMSEEAEVLVPAESKFEIVRISDSRMDMGYIEVTLKEV